MWSGYTEKKFLTHDKPDMKKINPLVLTMSDNSYRTVGDYAGKDRGREET
ncbi:FMN-binding protein [Desulfonema magnum]|uniref:FMN-binding protein n=1 Tax=Desulfonema magnum TaxID=45655 RepID=A0A975BGR9_9BACT|nr:FMN-binding protein [Desulfonema magnum]